MTLEVRPIEGEQELREFARVHATAFGHRWEDDKLENVILPWLPEVHAIAAFDGDTMVGASVDQPFEMTLPGGRMAPMRGITWVGVLPTHRGRGALRAMIEHQHASFREQGLAFSALFASETTIYGRFGYGPATVVATEAEIDTRYGQFAVPFTDSGAVVMLEEPEPFAVVREVIDRARPGIPGEIDRMDGDITDGFKVADRKEFRVAHRDAEGRWDGYAAYTIDQHWEHEAIPKNRLKVGTLLSATAEAHAALWRYLLDLRLIRTVVVHNRPLDDPIRWLLSEWRYFHVRHVTDGLWVALLELPAALSARGYLADGEVALAVDGTPYLVQASGGEGHCLPTDREPEIELGADTLASAFLGGYRFTQLRDGMRLRERAPGACVRADSLFRAERDPWCSYTF
ncbi:MAG TPA: GNAT family N-acetyltransferase [Gaiellales bacterium]|jgi:predicted acetyltransferase|nr:GNAT family N-acetyltransferase [Gaiellales bacterium]